MAEIVYADQAIEDLARMEEFAPGAVDRIEEAIGALAEHPYLGQPVEAGFRQLIISRGKTGYVAIYDFFEAENKIVVHRIRHQREEWRQ